MGICHSDVKDAAPYSYKQAEISRTLREGWKARAAEKSMLLLGAGQSGKSTFSKQLVRMYGGGFDPAMREEFRQKTTSFIIEAFRELLLHSPSIRPHLADLIPQLPSLCPPALVDEEAAPPPPFFPEKHQAALRFLFDKRGLQIPELKADMVAPLIALWQDPALSSIIERGELPSCESLLYFIGRLPALVSPDYLPPDDDIIMSRQKTTGIHETVVSHTNTTFRIIDVGGQRSERRKWIHCFDGVQLVIFFAPLSEYNQTLQEDPRVNRLHESLRLFAEVAHFPSLRKVGIVLFLNKEDLFREKLTRVPFSKYFPSYTGANNPVQIAKYIERLFLDQNTIDRTINTHILSASQSESVRLVFDALLQHIHRTNLAGSGLI